MIRNIHKSYMFWIIVAIVILVVILLVYNSKKKSKTNSTTQVASVFPLKLGSHGVEVLQVQKYFNTNNNCGLKEDGFMGQDTVNCVHDIWNVTEIDGNTYQNRILADNTINSSLSLAEQANQTITGLFSGWRKK